MCASHNPGFWSKLAPILKRFICVVEACDNLSDCEDMSSYRTINIRFYEDVRSTAIKVGIKGTPGRTRTCDPLLRRQVRLYNDELQKTKNVVFLGFFAVSCFFAFGDVCRMREKGVDGGVDDGQLR